MMADDRLSFWPQSRQQDGGVHTQYCFHMQATNLTDEPVRLSILRLVRPRIKRSHNELARYVRMCEPAIMPRAISEVSCDIIVDRLIGEPGKVITAVVEVSDQRGQWHKVKFAKLRSANQRPV
jgi:hypothetical protein